jgi:transcriptional regulator with XRE-family HTH domain
LIDLEKTEKGDDLYGKDRTENENIPLAGHGDESSFEVIEPLGKYLRAEREMRNLSLEEAAKFTKIRENFLRAIEEDKYELLPHPIYVRGFLTHYARYLGLDPAEVVHRYQKYHKTVTVGPPEAQKEIRPLPKRVKPRRLSFYYISIFAIVLLIPLLIYEIPHQSRDESPPVSKNPEPVFIPQSSVPASLPVPEKVATQQQPEVRREEGRGDQGRPTPDSAFEVIEAKMGTGIEWEGPRVILRGIRSEFASLGQRPYFFTRIKTQKEGKITHVWLREGKEFLRKEIEVRPPAWSVYTYIILSPHLPGEWKAEARDGDTVLASLNFKVTESTHPTQ